MSGEIVGFLVERKRGSSSYFSHNKDFQQFLSMRFFVELVVLLQSRHISILGKSYEGFLH